MIGKATVFEIHRLFHEDLSTRKIAKTLELARRTVTRYLRNPSPNRSRRKKTSKLDPYKPQIDSIIAVTPHVSAVAVHKLLINLGFDGKISILRKYLSTIRRKRRKKSHFKDIGHLWMLKLLQGKVKIAELLSQFSKQLDEKDIQKLHRAIHYGPLKHRNRAITVFAFLNNIPRRSIGRFLFLSPSRVREYIKQFATDGVKRLMHQRRKVSKKCDDSKYVDAVFAILHAPPSSYDINRTTWRLTDIRQIMAQRGLGVCEDNIRKIIRNAGYRFRKAKKVLTSNDPDYLEKLRKINNILSNLKPNEKFFSVDEFGPFAVAVQGGKSLVPPGTTRIVPQRQKSKGSLIITAALELSTNQITHFYSEGKNTQEMIKLVEVVLKKYEKEERIYFSWDAASWHASKEFRKKVEAINRKEDAVCCPIVELAPLPTCAQFLNVIESVFSGMVRAIIHNSDYTSVDECRNAIDRYFLERNQHFQDNPKRAGNKIWGKERVPAVFDERNNCKDSRY